MRRLRWITLTACAISLIAIFVVAPLLGSQITGASLILLGSPVVKAVFLVSVACSSVSVFLRPERLAWRATDIAPLAMNALSFSYDVMVSGVAAMQSPHPFSATDTGFIANILSSLSYLCLGLFVWAVAGLISRRLSAERPKQGQPTASPQTNPQKSTL